MTAVRALLDRAAALALAAGLVCAVLGGLLRGVTGVVSALVAVGLVLAFLLIGQLPVAAAARGSRWGAGLLLLGLYVTRVLVLVGGYLVVVNADTGLDRRWLGLTVMVSALAWTAGTLWSALRWRPYVVDPDLLHRD